MCTATTLCAIFCKLFKKAFTSWFGKTWHCIIVRTLPFSHFIWFWGQMHLQKMYHLSNSKWLTSAGAVGADSGVCQRRWAAWVDWCCIVVLGTASLDGSQVAVATRSEACWHGQVWRLWVVLRVGTGISECGLRAAVLIMMTQFQVP